MMPNHLKEDKHTEVEELRIWTDPRSLQCVFEVMEAQEPIAEKVPIIETPKPVLETAMVMETQKPRAETVVPEKMPTPAKAPSVKRDIREELEIIGVKITITIPYHIVEQGRMSSHVHRRKVAGDLAAQVLKKYPELVSASLDDQISVWSDIREFIVDKLK